MPEEVAALNVRLEATLARFERQMDRASRKFSTSANKIERRAKRLDERMSRFGERFGIRFLSRVGLAVVAIEGFRRGLVDIVRSGDRLRQLEGRFTALTGSAQRARALVGGAFQIGAATGGGFEAITQSLTRFRIAGDAIGATDEEVAKLTATLIRLGQIGGATQQEITAGTIQLGQALASGRLQGDELRSVLENLPLVARQIADGLGVGVGELRKMAEAGELTARRVFDAILSKTDEIERKFEELPPSLERSAERLAIAWALFTAELDESLRVSRTLVDVLDAAADTLAKLGGLRSSPVRRLAEAQAALSDLQSQPFDVTEEQLTAARIRVRNLEDEIFRPKRNRFGESAERAGRSIFPATEFAPLVTGAPAGRPFELGVPDLPTGAGGGGGAAPDTEAAARFLDSIRERIELVQQDQQLAGRSQAVQAQLTAAFERQRIVRELHNLAIRENVELTPEQIEQAEALARKYEEEAVALAVLEDVLESEARKHAKAEAAAERHRQAIERIGDAIANAIINANSFEDALRNVAVALTNIAIQAGANAISRGFTSAISAGLSGLIGGGSTPSVAPGLGLPDNFGDGGPTGGQRGQIAGVVHGEEFVVRAGPAQRHRALLEQINAGGLPGFQGGGFVGPAAPIRLPPPAGGSSGKTFVNIQNNTGEDARVEQRQGAGGAEIIDVIIGEVNERMGKGDFDRTLRGRYAIAPNRVKR